MWGWRSAESGSCRSFSTASGPDTGLASSFCGLGRASGHTSGRRERPRPLPCRSDAVSECEFELRRRARRLDGRRIRLESKVCQDPYDHHSLKRLLCRAGFGGMVPPPTFCVRPYDPPRLPTLPRDLRCLRRPHSPSASTEFIMSTGCRIMIRIFASGANSLISCAVFRE